MAPSLLVLVGALCVFVGVLLFALWIGGLVLRAAVGLTNAVLGGAGPSDLDYYGPSAGYRNGPYPHARSRSGRAVPVPTSGRAMGIVLLIGVVDFVARCALLIAAGAGAGGAIGAPAGNGGMGSPMAALIGLPVSLVIHISLLSSLLPTSLGRACFVVLFQFLIVLFFVLLLVAVVFACAVGRGGMR